MEAYGILWNPILSYGILRNPMESYGNIVSKQVPRRMHVANPSRAKMIPSAPLVLHLFLGPNGGGQTQTVCFVLCPPIKSAWRPP